MKFVVDAQLPPRLATWLRTKGHHAVALREVGLRDADDPEIWTYAETEVALSLSLKTKTSPPWRGGCQAGRKSCGWGPGPY